MTDGNQGSLAASGGELKNDREQTSDSCVFDQSNSHINSL